MTTLTGSTKAVPPEENSLVHLLAIEQIRQLKARYFRMIDTKDWEGFAAVFTPDATMVAGHFSIAGSDAIAASVAAALSGIVTVHHGRTAEIEIDSSVTAHGIWAMSDYLYAGGDPETGLTGAGHYHESYVRTDAGWRSTGCDSVDCEWHLLLAGTTLRIWTI